METTTEVTARRGRPRRTPDPQPQQATPTASPRPQLLPIDGIVIGSDNPRRSWSADGLRELAASIASQGLLQPVTVRMKDGAYILVLGERRLRACDSLGWERIPALVVEMDDEAARRAMIVENLQREGVGPVEEANAVFTALRAGMKAQELGALLGKSPRWVASRRAIAAMGGEIHDLISSGSLGIAHAEELARVMDPVERLQLAKGAANGRLSVAALARSIEAGMHEIGAAKWEGSKSYLDCDGQPLRPCSSCPMRSDKQADLFGSNDGVARCLDNSCWERKQEAYLIARRAELAKAGHALVSDEESYSARNGWDGFLHESRHSEQIAAAKSRSVAPRILLEDDGSLREVWHRDDLETPEEREAKEAAKAAESAAQANERRLIHAKADAAEELAGKASGKVDAEFLLVWIAQAILEDGYGWSSLEALLEGREDDAGDMPSLTDMEIPVAKVREALVSDAVGKIGHEGCAKLLKLLKVSPKAIEKRAAELMAGEE